MKIGFLGGTFDPIHFGHIQIALEMLENQGLDEIWFCPAFQSPFKGSGGISPEHRKKMVELGIDGIKGLRLIDLELKRQGPSYTVDTMRELKSLHPNNEVFLILGEDAKRDFSQWKEAQALGEMAPVLVGKRGKLDISSTEVRQRLKEGKFCGHLVPSKVLDYIHQYHLYY